jgi:hypothetical protein
MILMAMFVRTKLDFDGGCAIRGKFDERRFIDGGSRSVRE